jgi:hypothetical protein
MTTYAQVSSAYVNHTGTHKLKAEHLKTSDYRKTALGDKGDSSKVAEHLLEAQHSKKRLQREAWNDDDFHDLRRCYNHAENLTIRGEKVNAEMGQVNREIANGVMKLVVETPAMARDEAGFARHLSRNVATRDRTRQHLADKAEEFQLFADIAEVRAKIAFDHVRRPTDGWGCRC